MGSITKEIIELNSKLNKTIEIERSLAENFIKLKSQIKDNFEAESEVEEA